MELSRLFVAVWPPERTRSDLANLPHPDEPGVHWEPVERLHITLRFLGATEPGPVATALAGLADDLAGPVEAALGPAVSRLGRSVICVPVTGLDALAAAVVRRTMHLGEPPDPRPFAGHVTLARLRHRAACGVAGHRFTARFDVHEVALVASERSEGSLRYRTLARVPV
jgi:RNA 2',3'-cyclic 3'-phosphodiesterase